jgi:hypothetical protein
MAGMYINKLTANIMTELGIGLVLESSVYKDYNKKYHEFLKDCNEIHFDIQDYI